MSAAPVMRIAGWRERAKGVVALGVAGGWSLVAIHQSLVTGCCGGGLGTATVMEQLD